MFFSGKVIKKIIHGTKSFFFSNYPAFFRRAEMRLLMPVCVGSGYGHGNLKAGMQENAR